MVQPGPLFLSNFAGKNPSKMLRASRKQPFAFATACWRRGRRSSGLGIKTFALATQPCCPSPPAPEPPHQRCRIVLQFGVQCQFANTLVPRLTVFLRSLLWAVPAQVPEAVFPSSFRPVFAGVWEPEVSQPCPRQSQSSHPPKTASGTNPPLRSGASMV